MHSNGDSAGAEHLHDVPQGGVLKPNIGWDQVELRGKELCKDKNKYSLLLQTNPPESLQQRRTKRVISSSFRIKRFFVRE